MSCLAVLMVLASAVHAAEFPAKPIKLVVPFAPGGVVDRVARIVAPAMERHLGQPIVVDYRPGAGGTIGAGAVAKAEPDGHTLLLGETASMSFAPQMHTSPPYESWRDFAPVSQIGNVGSVLAVHPSFAPATLAELIELARIRPGELSFGSAGIGTTSHRSAAQFARMAGIDLIHVPYKGGGPATADLLAGRLSFIVESVPTALPQIRGGRLRALGVTTPARLSVLPNVPVIGETLPGFSESNWLGILAPAGTPTDVVMRLHAAVASALNAEDVRGRLLDQGIVPIGDSPYDFAEHLRTEWTRAGQVIRELGALNR